MSAESENDSVDLNNSATDSDQEMDSDSEIDEEAENDSKDVSECLDESVTESDNEETETEDQGYGETENEAKIKSVKSEADLLREKVKNRYKERQGKQLYVRFPSKLPKSDEEFQKKVLALSPLITKAHKPRQRHARFCLVDFGSQNDRNAALANIRNSVKKEASYKGIVVSIPHTESEGFVDGLIAKKLKSMEAKRAKARLKRASKKAKGVKKFTSTVVVRNLPGNVSMVEMRSLFPNAIDIQMKPLSKEKTATIATVTLPSSLEAKKVVHKEISLGETPLKIHFCGNNLKKSKKNNTNSSKDAREFKEKKDGEDIKIKVKQKIRKKARKVLK